MAQNIHTMQTTLRDPEKKKDKSGGQKLIKGLKRLGGRSSHSDKSSVGDNGSVQEPQSPTASAPSPNIPTTRQSPQQTIIPVPHPYSMSGQASALPGNQVALVPRKAHSNVYAYSNATQSYPRSSQDVQLTSTPKQNLTGMEKHYAPPTVSSRNDSHQGRTSSPEKLRAHGVNLNQPLPGLPYPDVGSQFSSLAESAIQGGRPNGRARAGSLGMKGVGETGAALDSPFPAPVEIPLRRADTLDNFTPKGNTPSATWSHPPSDYVQAQIQDLQNRLNRAEEDKTKAQEEAESVKLTHSTAVRDARSLVDAARIEERTAAEQAIDQRNRQIFELEESLKAEMLQAETKSTKMLDALRQKEAALAEAEKNFDELQKNAEVVYSDLDKAQEECRQLQEAEQEQLDTITRLNGDFGPHLSNDYFQNSLKELRTSIQIWAEDFFKGPIEESRPSPSAILANISDECNEYLRSPRMRPKLVEAYVWSILNSSVFASNTKNNPGLWWAHTRRNQLCGLRALLQPKDSQLRQPTEDDEKEIREYHRWRATTTRLIESKTASSTIYENVDFELIDKVLHQLKTYKSDSGFQRSKEAYHKRMDDIFFLAIKMDLEMNKQWAYYTIYFPPSHVLDHNGQPTAHPFNNWNMAVDACCGTETCGFVGLVMTPTLFVVGRNNGSGFLEGARVVEKSVIMPLGALSRENEDMRRGRNQGDPHQGARRQNSRSQQRGAQKQRGLFGF